MLFTCYRSHYQLITARDSPLVIRFEYRSRFVYMNPLQRKDRIRFHEPGPVSPQSAPSAAAASGTIRIGHLLDACNTDCCDGADRIIVVESQTGL